MRKWTFMFNSEEKARVFFNAIVRYEPALSSSMVTFSADEPRERMDLLGKDYGALTVQDASR